MKKLLITLAGVLLLSGCKWFTYTVKDVEVIDKHIKNYQSGDYPDYFITVKKDKREARIEVDSDDYYAIKEGQHIDMWVKESTGYLKEYKVNMGGK